MSERKRVFVLEFSPVVASDGSTQTFLFSTQGFSTGAADTPSNTKVKPFLSNPGSLKRDLFSEARVTGAIKPNYGNIVLRNPVQTKGGSGELDTWVDYGLAGTRIKCYWGVPGDAYPGSWKLVYIAYCHSFLADVNELVFRLRDQLQLLDNPVAAEGFLGSGGLEGNGGISKPKQWVSGDPGFITPILVDYAKQIYLVQVNGCFNPDFYLTNATPVNSFDVFEGGVEIDRAQPNYTSAADILANSPTAGTVRYFFGPANPLMAGWFDGPVYFRLGSPPANDLRVYAQGVPTSKDMLAWGSAFGSYTADLLAVRAGVPRTSISSGSAFLPVSYVLVDDATSYLSVLSDAALAYQGFFGFTRLDTFKSGYLCSPEDDGFYYGVTSSAGLSVWPPAAQPTTSLHTFNTDQVKDFKREPVSGMEVPIWSVQVSAGKTWPSKILAGASNEMKDYLARDPFWATVKGYSASTILANPGAAAAVVEIQGRVLQNSFGTRMWLERYFVLYGGRRHFYTFSVPMTDALLDLELHDVVTLQGPRYGLSSGKKFRIVGLVLDCSAAVPMVAFTCWGGDIGQYTGGGVPGVIWGGGGGGGGGGGTNTVENIARQALGDFTGQMIGSVSVGSSESPSCNPHYTQVALQANFEGADAATTSSDLSSHARTLTGTALYAALSTTRSKFGGSSLKITNKTSNGVAIARHADFAYTTSTPWTFGLWFYVDTWGAPASFQLVDLYDSVGGQAWWVGVYGISGSLHLSWNFGAGGTPTGSHVVSQGGWHYLEVVNDGSYSGNFIKGFLDGALDFTVAGSGAGTFAVYLGGYHSYGAASSADGYVMYIDEAMFTVGSALHSADFTPATQATPALQCGVGVVPGDGGTSLVATGMTSLGAFTGQLIGVAEFDQYYGLIRVLLHGNGSNGATTTVDSSNNVKTVTVQGSATLSTTQVKFGTASLYCPNTGVSERNGWKITDHTDFDFGTSDWTAGCWVYRLANTYVGTIWAWPGTGGTSRLSVDTSGALRLQYADSGGSVDRLLTPVLPLTTWTFLEVCRRGADIEVWMDGFIICREVRNVTYIYNTVGDIYVGCESTNSTQCFNGYIDEFCITATVARPSYYHFPASAADPSWSSTVLLMQGGSFADSSSYGKTITTSGSPTIGSGTALMDNSYYQGAAASYFKAALGSDGSMTADFTVEMSVSGGSNNVIFMSEGPASYLYNGTWSDYGSTPLALPTNYGSHERHMLAISRVGSSLKAFLDGKVVGTNTYSGTIDLQNLRFGHYIPNNNLYWTGAWDDIRITKGVGRWSANYIISQNVPTTPYFPG